MLVGLYLASIDQCPVPIRSLPAIILMHEDAPRMLGDTSEARGTCQIYSRQLATHYYVGLRVRMRAVCWLHKTARQGDRRVADLLSHLLLDPSYILIHALSKNSIMSGPSRQDSGC